MLPMESMLVRSLFRATIRKQTQNLEFHHNNKQLAASKCHMCNMLHKGNIILNHKCRRGCII